VRLWSRREIVGVHHVAHRFKAEESGIRGGRVEDKSRERWTCLQIKHQCPIFPENPGAAVPTDRAIDQRAFIYEDIGVRPAIRS
jgi:hypothetical protein